MRTISAMQDTAIIVPTMRKHIPQRVLSEPIAVTGMSVREAVHATAHRHDLRIKSKAVGPMRLVVRWAVCSSNLTEGVGVG